MYLGDIYTVAVNLCGLAGNHGSMWNGQSRNANRYPDDR